MGVRVCVSLEMIWFSALIGQKQGSLDNFCETDTRFSKHFRFFYAFEAKTEPVEKEHRNTNGQSRRVYLLGRFFTISIERRWSSRDKPHRGGICIGLKIIQSLASHRILKHPLKHLIKHCVSDVVQCNIVHTIISSQY